MRFESRTVQTYYGLLHMQEQEHLARLRAELDATRLYLKARREEKYSPEQPRDELGRWAPWDGHGDSGDASSGLSANTIGSAPDGTPIDGVGGIPDDKLNWTTQQFMSQYCKGSIRAEMPGQFLNTPISEIMRLAREGNRAARTCLKLLREDEYRK